MSLTNTSHVRQQLAGMTVQAKGLRTACQLFLNPAARQTKTAELMPQEFKSSQPQQLLCTAGNSTGVLPYHVINSLTTCLLEGHMRCSMTKLDTTQLDTLFS